jgi:hypothetical protein
MGFLDEDLDLIEVLDRPALFSNGRIPREAVPEGCYAYDLYQSCDTGDFCYIAPLVVVNHVCECFHRGAAAALRRRFLT